MAAPRAREGKRQDPEAGQGIRVCGGRSLQPVPTRQRSEQQGIGGRRYCYCTLCNWILCLAGILLLNRTYSSITEKGGRQRCCSLLGLTDIMIGVDKLGSSNMVDNLYGHWKIPENAKKVI